MAVWEECTNTGTGVFLRLHFTFLVFNYCGTAYLGPKRWSAFCQEYSES